MTLLSGSQARQRAGNVLNGQKVGGQFATTTSKTSNVVLYDRPTPPVSVSAGDRRRLPNVPQRTVSLPGFPMQVDSNLVGNRYALKVIHSGLPGTLVSTGPTMTYVSPGRRQLRLHSDGSVVSPGITESGDIYCRTHWDSSPAEISEDLRGALSLAIADDAALNAKVERFGDEYEMSQVVVEVHPHRETVQLFYEALNTPARGSFYYDTASKVTTVLDSKNRPVPALNTAMRVGEVLSDLAPENRNPNNVFGDMVANFREDPDYWAAAPSPAGSRS